MKINTVPLLPSSSLMMTSMLDKMRMHTRQLTHSSCLFNGRLAKKNHDKSPSQDTPQRECHRGNLSAPRPTIHQIQEVDQGSQDCIRRKGNKGMTARWSGGVELGAARGDGVVVASVRWCNIRVKDRKLE
jgi:hypothetical protein